MNLARGRAGARQRWRDKLVRAVADGVRLAVGEELERERERSEQRHREVLAWMAAWERRQRRDVFTALEQEAARSSAALVAGMPSVGLHTHPHDTLRHALGEAPDEGMVLEFGVASGTTLALLAEHRPGQVFGFDSFQGLPERWRMGFDAGAFATAELPQVPGAELVVGWFDETLPRFLADHPGPVALLHVDCDLYSSTATVLQHVGPRLRAGSVIVFDEYYNYPGWQEHEHRAFTEFVARTGVGFSYLGLTMDDEQVSVRITSVPWA